MDGEKIGRTPGTFKVSVCAKEVEVRQDRAGSVKKSLHVQEKEVERLEVVLREQEPPKSLKQKPRPMGQYSRKDLGPFEATLLGAPRTIAPESSLGLLMSYRRNNSKYGPTEITSNNLSLYLEGRVRLSETWELGLDLEFFDYNKTVADSWTSESKEFGLTTARVKGVFVHRRHFGLAGTLGFVLPTSTNDGPKQPHPFYIDPVLHLGIWPREWIAINLSLGAPIQLLLDDGGGVEQDYYHLSATLGTTVMPVKYIGGFLDVATWTYLKGVDSSPKLGSLCINFGLRSLVIDRTSLEMGFTFPVAGSTVEDSNSSKPDWGMLFRISRDL